MNHLPLVADGGAEAVEGEGTVPVVPVVVGGEQLIGDADVECARGVVLADGDAQTYRRLEIELRGVG